ncbi:hypothetical protein B0H14DRAFT_2602167 [Mycena olivaceomarginata]|nr:hypothetical protein B0H14DRAFT_2602167 [Mycena olivaceomarginata]
MSFACPTWYNPLIWVLVGALAHIIDVTTSRLCLEGHHRWSWDLSVISGLEIRWAWVMRVKDMVLTPALKIAVALAFPAIFAKLVSIFLLGLGPRDHKYSGFSEEDSEHYGFKLAEGHTSRISERS